MSIFNLETQNKNIENKIVAGLERLSQVFRILLWEQAKEKSLSPIQIQILIFIQYHSVANCTVSYLAKEFNITKPTISDAIKILEQKKLIKKNIDKEDSRSYTVQLTASGKKIVAETENFTDPLKNLVVKIEQSDKEILWKNISTLITNLNQLEIISVQRTCYNCQHFERKNKISYCNLLEQTLKMEDIRLDCGEFA
jgi:DNA-binding MarR family transcriptional regulator